jgi:hypothetical protein
MAEILEFSEIRIQFQKSSIQVEVKGSHLLELSAVADALAKHLQSAYNNHCHLSQSSEFPCPYFRCGYLESH